MSVALPPPSRTFFIEEIAKEAKLAVNKEIKTQLPIEFRNVDFAVINLKESWMKFRNYNVILYMLKTIYKIDISFMHHYVEERNLDKLRSKLEKLIYVCDTICAKSLANALIELRNAVNMNKNYEFFNYGELYKLIAKVGLELMKTKLIIVPFL